MDILIHGLQLKFCFSFGNINLYISPKYIIVLNSRYPFSLSNINKQKETKKTAIKSSFLSALINNKNKTPRRGGKKRYILLKLSYITNNATYSNGTKGFL